VASQSLAIISGFVGAVGSLQEAGARSQAAEYNADVAARNALAVREQTRSSIIDKTVETRRQLGQLRAAYGANGMMFSGSALDVLQDSATEASYDIAKMKYVGRLKEIGYQDERKLARMERKAVRTAGYMGAATSVLSGFSQALSQSPGTQDAINQAGTALMTGG
jgi:hypothetical protein